MDDRLDRPEASLRFRMLPRRGPFDEPGSRAGSVLELTVENDLQVTARFWLDPLAEAPADEVRVDAAGLGEGWIDGVLLSFVERALGRD